MKTLAIELKKGLNGLPFGSSTEEAKKVFGEPTEIDEFDHDDEDDDEDDEVDMDIDADQTELWYYDEMGVSLFFEGESERVLSSIELNNIEATLFGEKIFAMNESQIIELMNKNGFSEMYSEEEEWGEKLLSFEDALIDFYFEEDELITINWSDDSGEED
jgi:hypothetical protein